MFENRAFGDPAASVGVKGFFSIVSGLAEALGTDFCIVLYVQENEKPARVAAVANGVVAGLSEGDEAVASDQAAIDEICRPDAAATLHYFTVSSSGHRLRSTLVRIAGAGEVPTGFLAIHHDLARVEQMQALLGHLTGELPSAAEELQVAKQPARPESLVEQGLRPVRQRLGKPLLYASKVEKIQVVEWLDRDGFFLFKGAVEALAQEMGNTKYTIYAYLRETRMRSAD